MRGVRLRVCQVNHRARDLTPGTRSKPFAEILLAVEGHSFRLLLLAAALEELHGTLMLFGCRASLEGAEVSPPPGVRIGLARVQPILAGFQPADHALSRVAIIINQLQANRGVGREPRPCAGRRTASAIMHLTPTHGRQVWPHPARAVRTARAKVAELADALDLESSGETRESSSLSFRTSSPWLHFGTVAGSGARGPEAE